jgi:hypothetical protein
MKKSKSYEKLEYVKNKSYSKLMYGGPSIYFNI